MKRRGFLSIFAAGMAPAFVGASVLMPVKNIWLPPALDGQRFMITSTTPGAEIHFTTDGSCPTAGSPIMPADGIWMEQHPGQTLRAINFG